MPDHPSPLAPDRPLSVAPLWQLKRTESPTPLSSDLTCDTAIVGAGVAGLSIAHALVGNEKVVVLEANLVGEGSSGWSAGILSSATTIDLDVMEKLIGEENTRQFVFFFTDSIAQMKQALALNDEEWQFGKSIYIEAGKKHRQLIEEELTARRRFGLGATYLDHPDLLKPWPHTGAALELPDESAVHPVKLLLALAARVVGLGGQLFEGVRVRSWRHDGERFLVDCGDHTVSATNLIIATGIKSHQWREFSDLDRVCVPVTSHVLVTERSDEIAKMVKESQRIAMWDTLELYHYVRYLPDGRVLVGGADEPGSTPGQALNPSHPRIQELYAWAKRRHKVKLPEIACAWRASLTVPADGLPLLKVKTVEEGLLASVVTDGIPGAFLLGNIVSRLVREGEHPIAKLIASNRKLPADVSLLALTPSGSPLRDALLKAGFARLAFKDARV